MSRHKQSLRVFGPVVLGHLLRTEDIMPRDTADYDAYD